MAKKLIKISATRISMFLQCKQKYWFNYHDHLPKMSNPAFKLGLACHESLELAGQIWMEKGHFTAADKKRILDCYNEVSVREGLEDLGLHKAGIELVKRRIDNFALGKRIISLEEKFGFDDDNDIMTKDGVYLIGAMDKIIEVDEDTLMVVDYKTTSVAPTGPQLKEDMQLSIYDLVARMKWPEYKRIVLCLDLLKSSYQYTYRTAEESEECSDYLKVVHDEMSSLRKGDATPSLNLFCPWCDFRGFCRAYKKAYEKTNYTFENIEKYNNEDLIREWKKMRDTKKILEGRERELAMLIIEKIRRTGKNLANDVEELYIRQNSRTSYDKKVIHAILSDRAFLNIANINKAAVEKYMAKNEAIKDKITVSARTNFTSPFIASKKVKK